MEIAEKFIIAHNMMDITFVNGVPINAVSYSYKLRIRILKVELNNLDKDIRTTNH